MHSLWNDIERYIKTLQTKTLLFLKLIPANQRYTSMPKLERKASNSVFLISMAASILMFRNFKVTVVVRTLVRATLKNVMAQNSCYSKEIKLLTTKWKVQQFMGYLHYLVMML